MLAMRLTHQFIRPVFFLTTGINLNDGSEKDADKSKPVVSNRYFDTVLQHNQLVVPNPTDQSGRTSPGRFDLQLLCPHRN